MIQYMGHDHAHHHHRRGLDDVRRLALALGLVLVVLVVELVGAWFSGSLALLSDAAHMFTDAAALAIALAAIRISQRPADARRSFGYERFEVLAATLNAILLLVAAAYIVFEAVRRIFEPVPIASGLMLAVAVLGLAVNLAGMWLLAPSREKNLNMRGAYLEVWSDMLGSVGVIFAALAIRYTGWSWLDTVAAVAIGAWILPRSWQLLRTSINLLLEGVPDGVDLRAIEQALVSCPGVASVHDLHVWAVGSGSISLTVHVVAGTPGLQGDELLQRVRALLAERFGIHHTTVQLEARPCEQERSEHGFGPQHSHD